MRLSTTLRVRSMVLDQLLNTEDLSVIRFPNGDLLCQEALVDI